MITTDSAKIKAVRQDFEDDRFAASDVAGTLPSLKLPQQESDPRDIYQAVHDELIFDGNARQNLATFCQTWSEPQVHKLMDESISKNMIDKDEYPETAALEQRCIHMIADLWHSPEAATTMGSSAIGSSEAAMLGGLAMKWRWRQKMQAAGKDTSKPNIIWGPVQVCWLKFAKYWDIEVREIPMEGNRLIMNAEEVIKRCDENTIGVVPTLGVTYTGQYEPVKEVSDALDQLQKEKGWDIPIHVDAASGGFLAPFIEPDLLWDFRLPRVKSINASGHKFGLAPLGMGWVIFRQAVDLPTDLIFYVNYLGGNMPTYAINFSRPAGQIISQYYLLTRLGMEGYTRIQQTSYDVAAYINTEVAKMGLFQTACDGNPKTGIPAVSWSLKDGTNPGFTLYDLSDRLRVTGWQAPAYSMLPNRTDLVVQRVLCRHGFSMEMAAQFIADMQAAIAHFDKHPIVKPMTAAETAGFNHTGR